MKEKILWALAGALAILVLAGIFWLGKIYGTKKCSFGKQKNVEELEVPESLTGGSVKADPNSGTVAVEKEVSDAKTSQNESSGGQEAAKPSGWQTYLNKNQGYRISYPVGGKVTQPDPDDFEKDSVPAEGSCVTIDLANGYVEIFGKINNPDMAGICLGTGLGTEWRNIGKIEAEVFGKTYTVSGMGTSSASAGYRREFYVINSDTGERIKFGIEVNEKFVPEVTYEKAKAEVLKVLKTMEHI